MASDFLAFWVAGRMALQHHAAAAYDIGMLSRAEGALAYLPNGAYLAFFYPPPFLLLCLPFAALPLMATLRHILPRAWGVLPILAFPGLFMNAATGQNGFISASCFAAGLIWLATRPILAGASLGCLVFKPHLALAVPLVLIAARRWKALVACGASAALIMAISWAVLGAGAWRGFFHAWPDVRAALEQQRPDWSKLQSIFTSARWLGAPLGVAYAVQTALAAVVLAILMKTAWRRPGGQAEIALAAAASLLCTPHVLDYDLAVCAVPLAWIAALFCWPLVARIVTGAGLPIGPAILLVLFAITWRRAAAVPA